MLLFIPAILEHMSRNCTCSIGKLRTHSKKHVITEPSRTPTKMVRAVRTERQTSDCQMYYILVSVNVSCIRDSIQLENWYDLFVKVMQDGMACFHLFWFYILFMRQP